eukprot:1100089-Karenia_brevis.AAC.1
MATAVSHIGCPACPESRMCDTSGLVTPVHQIGCPACLQSKICDACQSDLLPCLYDGEADSDGDDDVDDGDDDDD